MDPVVSHVAANAALIVPGHRVLDPFCGTGSLLLASAFLGADVVGSDIDFDCLGLADPNELADKDRSKNARFKRAGVSSQLGKSMVDNFEFYGLKDRLVALLGMDAAMWGPGEKSRDGTTTDETLRSAVFGERNIAVKIREDLDAFGMVSKLYVVFV
jgi:SAM-dependent methyltransferase